MSEIIEKVRIDTRSSKPIYRQIAEQLQQLIATEQIKAGEHLPSVRHLGYLLDISPNTVAKAYLELERKQVVSSKGEGRHDRYLRHGRPGDEGNSVKASFR